MQWTLPPRYPGSRYKGHTALKMHKRAVTLGERWEWYGREWGHVVRRCKIPRPFRYAHKLASGRMWFAPRVWKPRWLQRIQLNALQRR